MPDFIPADIAEMHSRVDGLRIAMPPEDASDDDWESWAGLQELQAILAGWASRLSSGSSSRGDDARFAAQAQKLLGNARVLALLGNLADDAATLAERLPALLRGPRPT